MDFVRITLYVIHMEVDGHLFVQKNIVFQARFQQPYRTLLPNRDINYRDGPLPRAARNKQRDRLRVGLEVLGLGAPFGWRPSLLGWRPSLAASMNHVPVSKASDVFLWCVHMCELIYIYIL